MIPAPKNAYARYGCRDADGKSHVHTETVVAFTEGGEPLVVGDNGLVGADTYAGFLGIGETTETVHIPAGEGWYCYLYEVVGQCGKDLTYGTTLMRCTILEWLGDGYALTNDEPTTHDFHGFIVLEPMGLVRRVFPEDVGNMTDWQGVFHPEYRPEPVRAESNGHVA